MKRVYLLRHAKSSWKDGSLADRERPLAGRGRRAAKAVARHLEKERLRPDLVLCSPARRTRETLERVEGGFGDRVEARLDEALYGASESKLLACLKALPREVGSVLLIGHNLGLGELALALVSEGARVPAREVPDRGTRDDRPAGRALERDQTRQRRAGRLRPAEGPGVGHDQHRRAEPAGDQIARPPVVSRLPSEVLPRERRHVPELS
jgi:phosphohistidine phosphatase